MGRPVSLICLTKASSERSAVRYGNGESSKLLAMVDFRIYSLSLKRMPSKSSENQSDINITPLVRPLKSTASEQNSLVDMDTVFFKDLYIFYGVSTSLTL